MRCARAVAGSLLLAAPNLPRARTPRLSLSPIPARPSTALARPRPRLCSAVPLRYRGSALPAPPVCAVPSAATRLRCHRGCTAPPRAPRPSPTRARIPCPPPLLRCGLLPPRAPLRCRPTLPPVPLAGRGSAAPALPATIRPEAATGAGMTSPLLRASALSASAPPCALN
nr:WAS/WASL-interacting protein family member 3-like [Aegilops tauschii subsp. strangulata]